LDLAEVGSFTHGGVVQGGCGLAAVDDLQIIQLDQVSPVSALVDHNRSSWRRDSLVVGEEVVGRGADGLDDPFVDFPAELEE
jgi:hypothetical protein